MSPAVRALQGILGATLCLSLAGSLSAQGRPALVQSVDLFVPAPPVTVRILGKTNIVYELHITNFLPVGIALSRLSVLRTDLPARPLADYRDRELTRRIGQPGVPRGAENPQVIGPGMRAVAYLWIELPGTSVAPAALKHRVEVDVPRASGPVHLTVDGAETRLSGSMPVVLSPPLRGGPWTAIYDPLMPGGHRTAIYTLNGRARIPARFAVDWIRVPSGGAIDQDSTRRPSDWNGLGSEVLAVRDAIVVAAVDDIADNSDPPITTDQPMPLENASGNYVALDLGAGRFAFYEHLKRGSITVKVGDQVRSGQVIGRLGNSGSSSMGPHLHFHVSDANSPLGAEGVPFVFASFDQLGAFASIEAMMGGEQWIVAPAGQRRMRRLEHPGANAVVQFR